MLNLQELLEAASIKASQRDDPCGCEVAGQPCVNERSPIQYRTLFKDHCTYCLGLLRPGQPTEHHRGGERPIRLEVREP